MPSTPRPRTVERLTCRRSWKLCSAARIEARVRPRFRPRSYALRSSVEPTAAVVRHEQTLCPNLSALSQGYRALPERRGQVREERARTDGLSRLSGGGSRDVSNLYGRGTIRSPGRRISY